MVIKNTAGASGTIGATEVVRARPDGTTLLLSPSGGIAIQPHFQRPVPYTSAAFAPICQVVETPLITTKPAAIGIRSVADLLARGRAGQGAYPYSSAGVGTLPHIAMIAFTRLAGVSINHIPFRSSGEAVQAMMAGTLETCPTRPAWCGNTSCTWWWSGRNAAPRSSPTRRP